MAGFVVMYAITVAIAIIVVTLGAVGGFAVASLFLLIAAEAKSLEFVAAAIG